MSLILIVVFIFLFLRLIVAGFNYFSVPKLHLSTGTTRHTVSILIPARNEEGNILALLESISKQDYSHYEVIVLDDGSTDDTFPIASQFAAGHTDFKVMKGRPLPEGWTGKNYACWQLANEASGEYLLFLDADVLVAPGLLNSAISHAVKNKLSLLSLFSDQTMKTLGENAVIPLMYYLLLTLLPIRLIFGHPHPIFSAACGQFMLFQADTYRQYQWHRRVRHEVTEDLRIMRMLKQSGCKGDGLLANGLISCRMYTGYGEAIDGFSKNFIAPFNGSVLLFVTFLLTILVGPVLIIASGNLYLVMLLCALILLTRMFTSSLSGQNVWRNSFLHPLQMLSMLVIGCLAILRSKTKTGRWKGRLI